MTDKHYYVRIQDQSVFDKVSLEKGSEYFQMKKEIEDAWQALQTSVGNMKLHEKKTAEYTTALAEVREKKKALMKAQVVLRSKLIQKKRRKETLTSEEIMLMSLVEVKEINKKKIKISGHLIRRVLTHLINQNLPESKAKNKAFRAKQLEVTEEEKERAKEHPSLDPVMHDNKVDLDKKMGADINLLSNMPSYLRPFKN